MRPWAGVHTAVRLIVWSLAVVNHGPLAYSFISPRVVFRTRVSVVRLSSGKLTHLKETNDGVEQVCGVCKPSYISIDVLINIIKQMTV